MEREIVERGRVAAQRDLVLGPALEKLAHR